MRRRVEAGGVRARVPGGRHFTEPLHELHRKARKLAREKKTGGGYAQYRNDPVGFCQDVLGFELWRKQAEAAVALLKPPHQVMVESANNVGKSRLATAMAAGST